MICVEARRNLLGWLRRQLIGPAGDGNLRVSPLDRYPTGVLYPVQPGVSGTDPAGPGGVRAAGSPLAGDEDEDDDDALAGSDAPAGRPSARPVGRRRYVPPSAVGFSCFVRGDARLSISASAAVYARTGDRDDRGRFQAVEYERTALAEHVVCWPPAAPAERVVSGPPAEPPDAPFWEGRAGIDVRARPFLDGRILTVTLFNRQRLERDDPPRPRAQDLAERSLFEARLECAVEAGELVEYPRVDPSLLTEEEQELELQYADRRIHAVGHGAAVDWSVAPGRPARLWSEFMPATDTPLVTVDTDDDVALGIERLAGASHPDDLGRFVTAYGVWVAGQRGAAASLRAAGEREAASRICRRMDVALARMQRTVDLLRDDRIAAESFRLANRAMLEQMQQADRVEGKEPGPRGYRWRPFQLAFLLTVMESAIREDDDFRDVLDLIWFPTGGGKTEAYLGLIAFLIVWRRLQHREAGSGTAALMRYTLRLLTRQQFERAARMICALELRRRENPARLGAEPIEVGIWVGGEISPNRFTQAMDRVKDLAAGRPAARQALLVERCPWCRAPFDVPRSYEATEDDFRFRCANAACTFGADDRPLPCNVVDEALYRRPPSLLIGTIDKFARLAWETRSGAFFGIGAGRRCRPPELVIQDELHLITGPLGSLAGLYEAGLDTLLVRRGVRPKYVASTATIHMAREQVRRLYARDLAVFPPPGLSCDDSWFARTDHDRPGRLYVGYLAPLLDQQHCLAPLAAALLAGPLAAFEDDADREALLDAWWTLVIYHGSLKGVGNSHNAFVTDVRAFGRRLAGEAAHRRGLDVDEHGGGVSRADGVSGAVVSARDGVSVRDGVSGADGVSERIRNARVAQLTSMRTAQENARTFQQLLRPRGHGECLDAVLATNMVSVGLDVARLALMVVNGQPLTTAEYIQATSRVGRADVPGLVLANYFRHQARSLSHYESFRAYHESFYRFVEPGSVTPFTSQARSRALHAALVIALRHGCDRLRENASAGRFDRDASEVAAVVAELKRRCIRAAGDGQAFETVAHLDRLVGQWHDEARRCAADRRQLNYEVRDNEKQADRLLFGHGESRPGLWRTLHSMRNVESTGMLKLHD